MPQLLLLSSSLAEGGSGSDLRARSRGLSLCADGAWQGTGPAFMAALGDGFVLAGLRQAGNLPPKIGAVLLHLLLNSGYAS